VGKYIPTKTIAGQSTLFSAGFSSFDCITSRVVPKIEAKNISTVFKHVFFLYYKEASCFV
jgi:hypothetical protein